MADGGWEHIRGAYVTQHLIEGAGWKRCKGEENWKDAKGGLRRGIIKKDLLRCTTN